MATSSRVPPVHRDRQRWFLVKNSFGSTAPPFACLQIAGFESSTGAVTVTQTTSAGKGWCLNSSVEIASGGYGEATIDTPATALLNSSVAALDLVGPVASSWELDDTSYGFVALQTVLAAGWGEVLASLAGFLYSVECDENTPVGLTIPPP